MMMMMPLTGGEAAESGAAMAPAEATNTVCELRSVRGDSLAMLEEAGFYEKPPLSVRSPVFAWLRKLQKGVNPRYDENNPNYFQCVRPLDNISGSDAICGHIIKLTKSGSCLSTMMEA